MRKLLIGFYLLGWAFAADIVKHPRDLKYPALSYTPPKASEYRHKLAGGATAYMVPDRTLPLVNISVVVRAGSWLEPQGKEGLASLTGSQMRAGGTKTKPPLAFDEEAAYLAAQFSSFVGDTEGRANMNCLTKHLDVCLDMFFDMLHNPGFAGDRLNLAKTQLLQTLQRRNDATEQIESREFNRLMRGPDFFANRLATKPSIEGITREDMLAFHDRYYYPANFILAASGDFDPKDLQSKLESRMAGWANGSEKTSPIPVPTFTPAGGVYIVDKKGVNQGRVRMGHPGITRQNPDHIAISLMNAILGGGGFTSRILTRVRSDEGLAYQAASAFGAGVFYPGTFTALFQSKSPSVAQAAAIVLEEINRIRTEKVTPEELRITINSAVEGLPRRFATAASKAQQFATDDYENLPEDYWISYRDRVRAVTPDDVLRVAKQYLKPEQMSILIVGDAESIQKGNPDKPQFQVSKFGTVKMIPLPDPLTLVYPAQ